MPRANIIRLSRPSTRPVGQSSRDAKNSGSSPMTTSCRAIAPAIVATAARRANAPAVAWRRFSAGSATSSVGSSFFSTRTSRTSCTSRMSRTESATSSAAAISATTGPHVTPRPSVTSPATSEGAPIAMRARATPSRPPRRVSGSGELPVSAATSGAARPPAARRQVRARAVPTGYESSRNGSDDVKGSPSSAIAASAASGRKIASRRGVLLVRGHTGATGGEHATRDHQHVAGDAAARDRLPARSARSWPAGTAPGGRPRTGRSRSAGHRAGDRGRTRPPRRAERPRRTGGRAATTPPRPRAGAARARPAAATT